MLIVCHRTSIHALEIFVCDAVTPCFLGRADPAGAGGSPSRLTWYFVANSRQPALNTCDVAVRVIDRYAYPRFPSQHPSSFPPSTLGTISSIIGHLRRTMRVCAPSRCSASARADVRDNVSAHETLLASANGEGPLPFSSRNQCTTPICLDLRAKYAIYSRHYLKNIAHFMVVSFGSGVSTDYPIPCTL